MILESKSAHTEPHELMSTKSQQIEKHENKSMYSGITDTNRVYCYRHQEKVIEYFCRECHTLVCPRCMFEDHNGH